MGFAALTYFLDSFTGALGYVVRAFKNIIRLEYTGSIMKLDKFY